MKHDYTTLLHFLRTGELGQLKLGMSEQAVRDYLGEPDETFDRGMAIAPYRVSKHGCLGLLYHIGQSQTYVFRIEITVNQYPEHDLPNNLGQGWLPAFYNLSPEKVEDFLGSYSILFEASAGEIYLPDPEVLFEFSSTNRLKYFFHQNISITPLNNS